MREIDVVAASPAYQMGEALDSKATNADLTRADLRAASGHLRSFDRWLKFKVRPTVSRASAVSC